MGADGGATTGTYCVCDVICRHHWIRDFEEMNRTASIERRRPWQYKKKKTAVHILTYTCKRLKSDATRDMWKIEWKMRGGAVRTNPLDSSDSFLFFLSDARVKCAEPDRLRVYMGKCVKFAFFSFSGCFLNLYFFPPGGAEAVSVELSVLIFRTVRKSRRVQPFFSFL